MSARERIEEEIEIVYGPQVTTWCSRRLISALILPYEEHMQDELALTSRRTFTFRKPSRPPVVIIQGSVEGCTEMLIQVWNERGITVSEKALRA